MSGKDANKRKRPKIVITNSQGITLGKNVNVIQNFAAPPNSDAEEIKTSLASIEKRLTDISPEGYAKRILALLNRIDYRLVEMAIEYRETESWNREKLVEYVEVTSNAISELARNKSLFTDEEVEALSYAEDAIEGEVDLTGKFELTLPIIPFILAYKTELSASARTRISEIFKNFPLV